MKLMLLKISGAVLALSLVALEIAAQSGGGFPSRPTFQAVNIGSGAAVGPLTGALQISRAATPSIFMYDQSQAANSHYGSWNWAARQFTMATCPDNLSGCNTLFIVDGPSGTVTSNAVAGSMNINSITATNASNLFLQLGGTSNARVGVEGTAGSTVSGSAVGDAYIYSSGHNILFSINGAAAPFKISSAGVVTAQGVPIVQTFDATLAAGGVTVNNSAGLGTVAGTRSGVGLYQITATAGTITRAVCTQRSNGGIPAVFQISSLGSGVINIATYTLAGALSDVTGSWDCIVT